MDVRQELISLCTPVMNRLDDLRLTMPLRIIAANESPPVEILILDCGSKDGLQEYMDELMEVTRLVRGNFITYKRIERDYWHTAKAHNMGMMLGQGEYVVDLMADALIHHGYIPNIRDLIDEGCIWGRARHYCGNKWIKKSEFIDAGGYDERMELYGPDDRDLDYRLVLRGGKFGLIEDDLINEIRTPDNKKVANYRVKGSKHELSKQMRQYYDENRQGGVLVANRGKSWGNWDEHLF
jgi:glycosyltransferase involved in cell wall biosynthesis